MLVHTGLGYTIQLPSLFIPLPIDGTREFVGTAFSSHGLAFFYAIFVVMVLLMARIMFRSERRSFVAAVIFLTPLIADIIEGEFFITIFVATITSIAVLLLLVRFGILALLAFYTCRSLLAVIPLTLDSTKWYFGNGLAAASLVMALAIVGYWLATSKKQRILIKPYA